MTKTPSKASTAKPKAPALAASPPSSGKLASIIALIQRPDGATMDELMAATGWQKHSVGGAIAGQIAKKLGAKVISEKIDGVRRYRAPAADTAAGPEDA